MVTASILFIVNLFFFSRRTLKVAFKKLFVEKSGHDTYIDQNKLLSVYWESPSSMNSTIRYQSNGLSL